VYKVCRPIVFLFLAFSLHAAPQCPGDIGGEVLAFVTGIHPPDPCNNFNNGNITFNPPQLDKIPKMLEQLPQAAAQWFLNPIGGQLATLIHQARERARDSNCKPAPGRVVEEISRFMPSTVFEDVCWTVVRDGLTLDSLAINDGGMGAITLEDTIVFRDGQSASNPVLWAHELIHVCQYRRLGLPAFASIYSYNWNALENEAKAFEGFVRSHISLPDDDPEFPTQYYQAPPNWSPGPQIANSDYVRSAQAAIDPATCVRLERGGHPNVVQAFNDCPIVMTVTFFEMKNMRGQIFRIPCSGDCRISPGIYIAEIEPPGLFTVSVYAAVW
jgi:hypothetical protein